MDEENKGEYVLYAITKSGEGLVMEVGRYKEPEDIEIFTSVFGKDIKLEIEYERKEKNN